MKKRVAGRPALQGARELRVADERGGLGLVEPRQREAVHGLLAAEVGEQPRRGARRGGLDVAAASPATISGAPCRRRARRGAAAAASAAVAHCRSSSTSSSGARGRRLREQRRDRLEEPVARGLGARRPGRSGAPPAASSGTQRRELLEVRRGRARRARPPGAHVAQRLHERLVGHDGLLVDPPVEHRRAARVGRGGERGGQPRLADAGLARQQRRRRRRARAPAVAQHARARPRGRRTGAPPAARGRRAAGRPRARPRRRGAAAPAAVARRRRGEQALVAAP